MTALRRLDLWVIALLALLLGASIREQQREAQQSSTLRVASLSAATTGTGSSVNVVGRQALVLYVRGTGTLSTGVVTLEEADYNPSSEAQYAGTWSAITTVNASTVTGGAQVAYHFPVGAYRFVRARVTTTVTGGGSVTAVIAGH